MLIVCSRNDRDQNRDNYNRDRNYNRGDKIERQPNNRDQQNRGPPPNRDDRDNRPPKRSDDENINIENRMPKLQADVKPVCKTPETAEHKFATINIYRFNHYLIFRNYQLRTLLKFLIRKLLIKQHDRKRIADFAQKFSFNN